VKQPVSGVTIPPRSVLSDPDLYRPFLCRLEEIYMAMDRQYDEAAGRYGFDCRGCEENCCRTRFYHYTVAEYLYLHQGYGRLDEAARRGIQRRSQGYRSHSPEAVGKGQLPRFCPLNVDGSCMLYAHRPMICRLHGIPYELRRPGRPSLSGPGCKMFAESNGGKGHIRFDRTPHYGMMAGLERDLRAAASLSLKVRMSVADMFADEG